MTCNRNIDIDELIRQEKPVLDAIRRGGIEAMKKHIQAGKPMVSWKNGKIYMIPPDELAEMLKQSGD